MENAKLSEMNLKELRNLLKDYGYRLDKFHDGRSNMHIFDRRTKTPRKITFNSLKSEIIKLNRKTEDQVKQDQKEYNKQQKKIKEQEIAQQIKKQRKETKAREFIEEHNIPLKEERYKENITEAREAKKDLVKEFKKFNNKSGVFRLGYLSKTDLKISGIALREFASSYFGEIKIRINRKNGSKFYMTVTPNSIRMLENLVNDDDNNFINYSDGLDDFNDFENDVELIFEPNPLVTQNSKHKLRSAEFFPYYNRSNLDLEIYDIFSDKFINKSCFISSFINSKILTDNEIGLLQNSIQSRCVNKADIYKVCILLNVFCKLFFIKIDDEFTNKKSAQNSDADWLTKLGVATKIFYYGPNIIFKSMKEYNDKTHGQRCINIILLEWPKYNINHYMYDPENLQSTDPKKIPETSIVKIIPKLMLENKFEAIPINVYKELEWTYEKETSEYNVNRDVKIPTPKFNDRRNYGKKLFGFDPGNDLNIHLRDLQKFIDSLNLNIKVKGYYTNGNKLMERIMFEYGCFNYVQEYSGNIVDEYRSKIKFAKSYIPSRKAMHLKEKLYYIDINGAYSASANGIPLTLDKDSPRNYKINDLLNYMYDYRKQLIKDNNRIEKTIKYMMCTPYGNSIRKNKIVKHIFTDDLNSTLRYNDKYVLRYTDDICTIVKCFLGTLLLATICKRVTRKLSQENKRDIRNS